MKEIKLNAISNGTRLLPLGRQGENEAIKIIFDVSRLIAEYGEGVAVVTHMRSKDTAPYVKVTERDGVNVTWNVNNTDTLFDGSGKANLMWNVNGVTVKTIDFDTYVFPSISGIVTVPDALQSWYNEMIEYINSVAVDDSKIEDIVLEYLEEHPIEAPVTSVNSKTGAVNLTSADVGALAKSELDSAINTALATAKASGEFDGADGQNGQDGQDGQNGYSPTVSMTEVSGGTKLDITDVNGVHTTTILNGVSGTPSELDEFINNIDLDYEYDEATNANYTIVRVYRDKLDGTKQYPFVYAPNGADACEMSTYEIAHNDGWLLAINGGIFNTTTHKADGLLVENGIVYQNSASQTHPNCRPLIISNTGELSEGSADADATTLINNGAVSVICGFMAIVKNYQAVPSSEWNNVAHYTQNAQRQIIGQFGNGDYAIITCEGRNFDNSDGWTIAEAQQICIKHGLKFAYNLDGGGSTETMLGLKHLNTIYEGTSGRKVPTFIVFNGKDKFNDIPTEKHLTSISANKTTITYQVGDTLNTDDITVTAYFSDGTSENVTSDSTINTNSVNMEVVGTYSIEISYTDNDITKTTSINIVVEDEETPIDYEFVQGYTLINTGECAVSDNRITAVTNTPNDAPIRIENDGLLGYFIPIPTGSTRVTITTPNYIAGVGLWNSEIVRVVDGGWSPTIGECTQTYEVNTYSYLSVNIKNSSNSTIPVDVDTSNWTIEFN